ncbi:MAG: DNA-directed RNA polymerase subunit beta [Eubacteriales bacterium]|nr:DNA-directed RNA polymerase subunit beta [Eubacteriales bacterium]MDD3073905.1 DNA-directed RNA polymerase subunit beta [Eubacteriales bacterium]MDD4079612.1 DNA-directed RNA polymerase subunit beta [Eubacteriales bacterium]MDD4769806.1 DNA-directed RNA polymerase subunit beta [Eubacteriales bacterium]
MTESPIQKNTAPIKDNKGVKVLINILKIIWIPALLILALIVGLYLGYQFITKTSGSNIFNWEIWQRFFQQIRSLR